MRDHGTHVKYVIDRCRCQACVQANRDYERERRARIEPAYVTAGPARNHIRELMAAGVGLKRIAKVSGVSHGGLSKLIYGTTTRAPSKRVRKATQDRILAVTPADIAPGAITPAAASWALIDAMLGAGVPKVRIAEHLGQTTQGLQLSRNHITARNAAAVRDLHRAWTEGTIELSRNDRHGNTTVAEPTPPPAQRGQADITDLISELADIVEERNSQPWRTQAACRNRPTWMWFPARGDTITTDKVKRICQACLVRDECRAANIDKRDGIYGALSGKARRDLRRIEIGAA